MRLRLGAGGAAAHFVARYGRNLLHRLHDAIHTDCLDHQVIEL